MRKARSLKGQSNCSSGQRQLVAGWVVVAVVGLDLFIFLCVTNWFASFLSRPCIMLLVISAPPPASLLPLPVKMVLRSGMGLSRCRTRRADRTPRAVGFGGGIVDRVLSWKFRLRGWGGRDLEKTLVLEAREHGQSALRGGERDRRTGGAGVR